MTRPMHLTGLAVVGIGTGFSAIVVALAMSRLIDSAVVRQLWNEDPDRIEFILAALGVGKILICIGLLRARRWAWILALAACAAVLALSIAQVVEKPAFIGSGLLAFVAAPFVAYLLLRADTRAYVLGSSLP